MLKMPPKDPDKIWTALFGDGMLSLYRGEAYIGLLRHYRHLDPPKWFMEIDGVRYWGDTEEEAIEAWRKGND